MPEDLLPTPGLPEVFPVSSGQTTEDLPHLQGKTDTGYCEDT